MIQTLCALFVALFRSWRQWVAHLSGHRCGTRRARLFAYSSSYRACRGPSGRSDL